MKRASLLILLFIAGLLSFDSSASGGAFLLSGTSFYEPFIIVHPTGYTGAGGLIELEICTAAGAGRAVPGILSAAKIWNMLTPLVGNCSDCRTAEEGDSGKNVPASLGTVLLHELGHCAVGLDHSNWIPDPTNPTSFTSSKDVTSFSAGNDIIIGSSDDRPSPLPGTRVLHWFRKFDNDPFVIDNTVIDSSTFTRRIIDLPAGHSWQVNGNRAVGDYFGIQDSQVVMYGAIDRAQVSIGLAADDVNTVKYAMTGIDEQTGTADDYTFQLSYSPDCSTAEIEVMFLPLGANKEFGFCEQDLTPLQSPPGTIVHHAIIPFPGNSRILLILNSDKVWDGIFGDGFESGNLSEWSTTSP